VHIRAPKNCKKNEFTTHFKQEFTMDSYGVQF
jgi:hypothetical protein